MELETGFSWREHKQSNAGRSEVCTKEVGCNTKGIPRTRLATRNQGSVIRTPLVRHRNAVTEIFLKIAEFQ